MIPQELAKEQFIQVKKTPHLLIITLCLIFISTGSFGLLNIFNLRREVQFVSIFALLLYSPLLMLHWRKVSKKPLIWLNLIIFLYEFVLRQDIIIALDSLVTFIVIGVLFSISPKNSQKVLKGVIIVCGFFSFLVLIQAIILVYNPNLIDSIINSGYTSSTRSDAVELKHSLAYLGFGYHKISLAEITFVRLTSFAAEPSVLIYSFLTPGVLALTFKGWIRKIGYIILFFVVILSFSGTVYLIAALSIAFFYLFKIIKNERLRYLLPFLIIFSFTLLLIVLDVNLIVGKIVEMLSGLSAKYSIFSKQVSALERLKGMAKFYKTIPHYPFGSVRTNVPMSILLSTYFLTGIVGLILISLALKHLYKLCSRLFNDKTLGLRLTACIIYAIFIVVAFFSDYGWRTTAGYIILVLTILRLEYLLNQKEGLSQQEV